MRQEQSGRNSVQVGIHNRQLVLDVIRTNQPITRREIARLTGLTSAAVTNIVSNFIEQGFVREVGYGRSGGGRKPKLVELDKGSRIMVAVDLAGADQIAALLDMDGNVLCRGERRIGSAKGVTVADIVDAINEILDTPEARSGQVVGIGVTTPGLVDAATGTVLKSVALNWFNVPIKAALQKHFEYPVFIGKDTHVALLAEEWYGAAKNMQNAIYLWVGPGIAIGMLLDGRVYTGSTGMAGEFGHVSIDYDGPACKCGSWGCMEQMASLRAISSMAAKSDRDAEGYSGDPEERYIDP
ncbi:MAG TPA: ROK family transcriptional regulator, partial [Bacillota bacterium]|nr:ROK family transcriptional regulator [Bacillota bacterium]